MRLSHLLLLVVLAVATSSCSDDDSMEMETQSDTTGPSIYDHRWIDSPFYENDPSGDIEPGGEYQISIESGFQFLASVSDESNMTSAEGYMTINNDQDIREYIFGPAGAELGYQQGTFTFTHRTKSFALGQGVFYQLQPGDGMQFYISFVDEYDNETVVEWTANLVQ